MIIPSGPIVGGARKADSSVITVVISLKNNVGGLRATLDSMISQAGCEHMAVLIMDANSSDFPIDAVNHYSGRIAIDFICAFDSGIYQSWNRALPHVATPWLTFFGSGDTFTAGAISRLIDHVAGDPAVDIISSRSRNIFENGKHAERGRPFDVAEFARIFSINHSGTLYRRTFFDAYGNFDERFRSSGDYEFLTRVGSRARFGYLDTLISEYLVGGISSSSTLPLKETYAIRKRYKSVGRLENLYLYWRGMLAMRFGKYLR